jgi:hypothetical protein
MGEGYAADIYCIEIKNLGVYKTKKTLDLTLII